MLSIDLFTQRPNNTFLENELIQLTIQSFDSKYYLVIS